MPRVAGRVGQAANVGVGPAHGVDPDRTQMCGFARDGRLALRFAPPGATPTHERPATVRSALPGVTHMCETARPTSLRRRNAPGGAM